MLLELAAIVGFLGIIIITGSKLFLFSTRDYWKNPPYSMWIGGLTLVALLFCWGLYMIAYLSSFGQQTTITGDSSITIKDNSYLILNYFSSIATAIFTIGIGLSIMEFIFLFAKNVYSGAKNSSV